MEQAVEFEPMDSVVYMLNTIANNIAQKNANYLTTPQNVSMFRASPTGPVNLFSQACFNLFMPFKIFTRRQKRSRIEQMMPQAFVMLSFE